MIEMILVGILVITAILAHIAVKNEWKIVDYF